jgi:hypothetical protein
MRGTIVRIGAAGAGVVLALGLFAAGPAGAAGSGKQSKSKGEPSAKVTCFHPEGKTQGRSLSDPDGMSNGGADKPSPGCSGGVDLTDRDGNNGCGNDADREDDNNGNCGKKADDTGNPAVQPEADEADEAKDNADETDTDANVQAAGSETTADATADEAGAVTAADSTTVLGSGVGAPAAEETTTSSTAPETQVLGETLSAPDTLARTGAGIGGLALLGGLLVGGGRLTVLARKLLRIG